MMSCAGVDPQNVGLPPRAARRDDRRHQTIVEAV
jgi:hypothetical protein